MRGAYLQKAKEFLDKNIEYLVTYADKSVEHIRVKYLAKLYESLGHLYCDPYLFDIAEKKIQKAEDLYNADMNSSESNKIFSDVEYWHFLMKKSAFLKKNGFFLKSFEILKNLEDTIMEELKKLPPQSTD